MRIVWSPQALNDREAIWEFIGADDPAAATRFDADLADAIRGLRDYPNLGRPGIVSHTRELFPIRGYRIVYEVGDDQLQILAIVHTSRRWPS